MSTTPPPPTSSPSGQTGIEITARYSFWMFVLALFKPKFVIDGQVIPASWKNPTFFAAAPGQHQVQVHFPYLFLREAGKGVTTVNVQPGQVTRVGYKAPWLVFLAGKMKIS